MPCQQFSGRVVRGHTIYRNLRGEILWSGGKAFVTEIPKGFSSLTMADMLLAAMQDEGLYGIGTIKSAYRPNLS